MPVRLPLDPSDSPQRMRTEGHHQVWLQTHTSMHHGFDSMARSLVQCLTCAGHSKGSFVCSRWSAGTQHPSQACCTQLLRIQDSEPCIAQQPAEHPGGTCAGGLLARSLPPTPKPSHWWGVACIPLQLGSSNAGQHLHEGAAGQQLGHASSTILQALVRTLGPQHRHQAGPVGGQPVVPHRVPCGAAAAVSAEQCPGRVP